MARYPVQPLLSIPSAFIDPFSPIVDKAEITNMPLRYVVEPVFDPKRKDFVKAPITNLRQVVIRILFWRRGFNRTGSFCYFRVLSTNGFIFFSFPRNNKSLT
jgi:hypothetical protein